MCLCKVRRRTYLETHLIEPKKFEQVLPLDGDEVRGAARAEPSAGAEGGLAGAGGRAQPQPHPGVADGDGVAAGVAGDHCVSAPAPTSRLALALTVHAALDQGGHAGPLVVLHKDCDLVCTRVFIITAVTTQVSTSLCQLMPSFITNK